MAYDLVFWRAGPAKIFRSPRQLYEALLRGDEVSELERLDAQPMISALRAAFSGCEVGEKQVIWESSDPPRRGFQLHAYERHVDVHCQQLAAQELNVIIDAGLIINCPLYDPQEDKRFDGAPVRPELKQTERLARLATAIHAAVDELGWVTCPGCSRRFKVSDANVFADSTHLKCSQRIALQPSSAGSS
jgi:hypothetical protein